MGATLNGLFETRRDAEMAVERLVQDTASIAALSSSRPWGLPIAQASRLAGPTTMLPRRARVNGPTPS